MAEQLPLSRVAQPPSLPHVLFDGACGFCRFWIARWRARMRERMRFDPYQEVGLRYPEVPPQASEKAVQLIDADGRIYAGADAVFRMLRSTGWRWLGSLSAAVPLFRKAAHVAYGFVAKHRMLFSRLTRLGWGQRAEVPTFAVARRLFAHGLGLVFAAAFGSWLWQWRGLISSKGIAPVAEWMAPAREQLGTEVFLRAPSLFWLGQSDVALFAAGALGLVLAGLLTCGIAPGACAFGLWALYLSFCTVASPFLDYQWDSLLLETALLSAVFLPWQLRPQWRLTTPLTTLGRWLLWWLLARLMLESGIVKLASGDPHWRNLTAMAYHYETQPLPLPTAWIAHHAPLWFHKLEALGTFIIEFAGPLLMFGPRHFRHLGAYAMAALQFGILATGNYAFFNLLVILMCALLLEDSHWPTRLRAMLLRRVRPPLHERERGLASWVLEPLGVCSALLTGLLLVRSLGGARELPRPVEALVEITQPWRSFNAYGLFAVMTTSRPEIIVEGSTDGATWLPYEFRWKPGALDRMPTIVAPHQPRLDWQMWFAALSRVEQEPWFVRFLTRLLQGSPEVRALLQSDPFPGAPPRYVRAMRYQYHFTRPGEGAAWWKREPAGIYCPPVTLSGTPRS